MGRLGGRTARNAVPVDPAIRTTHLCQCMVECGLQDRSRLATIRPVPPKPGLVAKSGRFAAPSCASALLRGWRPRYAVLEIGRWAVYLGNIGTSKALLRDHPSTGLRRKAEGGRTMPKIK